VLTSDIPRLLLLTIKRREKTVIFQLTRWKRETLFKDPITWDGITRNEVTWDEVTWGEVTWGEVTWGEVT
jgi:hypothetical protein